MITSRILDAEGFVPESTWTPTHWYAAADRYSALDAMGVELEVAEFLYGLVRMMKPERVCETGAYPGVATQAILRALTDNHYGALNSCEEDESYRLTLATRFGFAAVRFYDRPPRTYAAFAITFLDSPYEQRLGEFRCWLDTAVQGSVLVVHDTKAEWDKGMLAEQGAMVFDTPRGLAMLRR